jgi:hypothetical protein
MKKILLMPALFVASTFFTTAAIGATTETPLSGCYERIYDSAHLAQHKGQIVTRVTLWLVPNPPERIDQAYPVVANGTLKIWIRGVDQSFDSIGACLKSESALSCDGSLSAAEADPCKSKEDGVRDCRIDFNDSGSFKLEGKPQGMLVTLIKQLELVHAPYDGGPFLYLSPTNAENHAFLLKAKKCP